MIKHLYSFWFEKRKFKIKFKKAIIGLNWLNKNKPVIKLTCLSVFCMKSRKILLMSNNHYHRHTTTELFQILAHRVCATKTYRICYQKLVDTIMEFYGSEYDGNNGTFIEKKKKIMTLRTYWNGWRINKNIYYDNDEDDPRYYLAGPMRSF